MFTIREARPEDAAAVVDVSARSWQAAYPGLLPEDVIARVTSPAEVARRAGDLARLLAERRWRECLIVAEPAGPAEQAGIVGYARFGPERDLGSPSLPPPAAPAPGARAELYAIYALPQVWSAGAGRALITEVIQRATARRHAALSLWVLEGNARARRFYEKAGFAVTGLSKAEDRLGGVTEVQYARQLG